MMIAPANPASISTAAEILRRGDLCVLPTETVYGVAADAMNNDAIAKIYALKSRPQFNPLIVHGACRDDLERIAIFDDISRAVADQFWPAPLTLILPLRAGCGVSDLVTAGLNTIAVRVPAHAVFQAVLKESGLLIAAPSANKSGEVSPTAPHHVATSFGDECPYILAAGSCSVGLESTILDLSHDVPYILRHGAITADDLADVLGTAPEFFSPHDDSSIKSHIKSPGQLLKHYAPRIPVRLHAVDVKPDEALLAFGPTKFMGVVGGGFAHNLPAGQVLNLSAAGDLDEAAANLFAHLHALDRPEFKTIAVMNIPDIGIGLAINDRLKRAANC